MNDYSEVRYLLSKKPVDDRALNQTVLSALRSALAERAEERPLQVLEIGAGVGTMVTRLADWKVIQSADYTLIDRDLPSLQAAEEHIRRWAGPVEVGADGAIQIAVGEHVLRVRFIHGNALEWVAASENRQRYDLVTANAVLDLMDLRPALERIWQALRPAALFWFTINFDGESIFLPELGDDAKVIDLYHRTMDERLIMGQPSGDSKTGRHLLELIPQTGACLMSAGSSDWVVIPGQERYANDEGYFLHHIINTIWTALEQSPHLERAQLARWVSTRHEQIERAQLIYIAHQLDVLGRSPSTPIN
jgi:hypothetical protein